MTTNNSLFTWVFWTKSLSRFAALLFIGYLVFLLSTVWLVNAFSGALALSTKPREIDYLNLSSAAVFFSAYSFAFLTSIWTLISHLLQEDQVNFWKYAIFFIPLSVSIADLIGWLFYVNTYVRGPSAFILCNVVFILIDLSFLLIQYVAFFVVCWKTFFSEMKKLRIEREQFVAASITQQMQPCEQ
jgi:hypothetical protein